MKHVSIAALIVLALTSIAVSQQIQGDYVETRSADVYTGQCFANGEVNLVGNEAIMGWRIEQGEWNGVSLNGLAVVAGCGPKPLSVILTRIPTPPALCLSSMITRMRDNAKRSSPSLIT